MDAAVPMATADYRILRVLDTQGNTTDFKVSAVFLLASEVWEPLASGCGGYISDDSVVLPSHMHILTDAYIMYVCNDRSRFRVKTHLISNSL